MSDQRFTALTTDPRYRLPSRKEARTAVDPRFKRLFTDQDFRKKATVDQYGRRVQDSSGKKDLKRLYRLERDDASRKERTKPGRDVVGSSDEETSGEDVAEDLRVEKKDLARDGGFSESSSEEETSSGEEEDEEEAELADATAGHEQTEQVPMGEVSRRIACVNLDWDNIRAVDILAVAASFAPGSGSVESVTIYPSEFGRERMQREELEGPPREIFTSTKRTPASLNRLSSDEEGSSDDGEDEEKIKRQLQQQQVDDGEEFDTAKLRQYQLERLRYFYAVISCDSKSAAKALYEGMDGREYLTTSNFFDLRFVPDDTTFEDDEVKDECKTLLTGYKPNDFRTEALTHSKVRLTWDDDDATRKEVQKRAFSRAEMDQNDLQAYIGSESSDAESISSRKSAAEDRKAKKKEAERAKMRAALGLSDSAPTKAKPDKDEVVGDMQITFTSGLGNGAGGKDEVFENEPQDEESTRARYIRKERERKQKRKDKLKLGGSSTARAETTAPGDTTVNENQGFDDPFFADPDTAAAAEKKAKKAEKQKKVAARAAQDTEARDRRAELELLMADDGGDNSNHFDMREIEKAQKEARRKSKTRSKYSKKRSKNDDVVDTFQVETQDPRFQALFDSHEYAIDPTNPRYKSTEGMKALLEEGRKKRKVPEREDLVDEGDGGRKSKKSTVDVEKGSGEDLAGLVTRLGGGKKQRSSSGKR